jgi:hypothetical protein
MKGLSMARKFYFPDPNDRSANAPSVIVSKPQVIGIWNQEHPDDKMERVTERVQTWFKERAKDYQWDEAHFSGNECQLRVNLTRRTIPDEN